MGERRKIIDRFQEGDLPVIISNAATGGTAINLSRADWLLFYESPPGVISRKQAESRPLARGERPLVMDDLVCASIEQRILDFNAEGKSFLDALVGDRDLIKRLRE
jgi:SNF2 family DNA or RNA helicase